jgi:type IV secretory pathway TrbD component
VTAAKPFESSRRASTCSRDSLLVCAVGIAVLVCDSWPNSNHGPRINLHAAFGTLLWLMAVAQFRLHALPDGRCRQPSRAVYFVLYVVFGAEQIIRMGASLWNHGSLGVSHPAILPPPENLRDILAYGILALLTIRVQAALYSPAFKRSDVVLSLPDLQHHK